MTGVKRYEDELFSQLQTSDDGLDVDRDRPASHPLWGSTVVSWTLRYRSKGAEVVHATDETLAPLRYLRSPKKLVVTCHGLIPLRYPSTMQDLTTRLQWRAVPKALEAADRVIAISAFTKEEILALTDVPSDRIDVVHHGVDHETYRPLSVRESRKRLGLSPDLQYVLIVASTLEQKRMDLAQGAYEQLRSMRGDSVRLLKAGYAESLVGDGVVNTGWLPEEEMPYLYNAADVFFHPSEYESFGLPVLEAMACGTPVVASDRASIPEVVGDAGQLIDPHDEEAVCEFAEALDRALEVGQDDGCLQQSQDFSWERTASDTLAVYERCR